MKIRNSPPNKLLIAYYHLTPFDKWVKLNEIDLQALRLMANQAG